MTLKEIAEAAKAEGISYGEYVSRHSPPVTVIVPEDVDQESDGSEVQDTPPPAAEPEPQETERVCPECGRTFLVASDKSRRIYCSQDCKKRAQYSRSKIRYAKSEKPPATDPVSRPDQITPESIECIDAIKSAVTGLSGFEGYCTGNAMEYEWRWKQKGGVQDVDKAIWYLTKLREHLMEGT